MENNGRGIFYGVIGVATLVVAIMGATFAYFAASAAGEADALNATSATVSGTLAVTTTSTHKASQLIPATNEQVQIAHKVAGTNHCKGYASSAGEGSQSYDLCSTYDFEVRNTADFAQTYNFDLVRAVDTFGTNGHLYFCLYLDNGNGNYTELVECAKVPQTEETRLAVNAPQTVSAGTGTNPGKVKYRALLYILETGDDQTTTDSGKSYGASLNITTSTGTSAEQNITGIALGATG